MGSASEDILLPGFVLKSEDGVYVLPSVMPSEDAFRIFFGKLFTYGARFSGLNYELFQKLLYDFNSIEDKTAKLRLADNIVAFSDARKALYRNVRIHDSGSKAEYMFEPVFLEVTTQVPVYGEPDEEGTAAIVNYRQVINSQQTKLNFDEFVADMWQDGVQFGINAQLVKNTIAHGQMGLVVIANERPAIPGIDAELQESCEGLHRDDSPSVNSSGKTDLRRFKNRFPQIKKGQRMMRKIPRTMGKWGFLVTGKPVEPELPKDLDMHQLAGPGTKVEASKDGEFIVAIADGFLSIDLESNRISVTEKIENKGGISAKTTGDLSLSVDDFVERGEVQEGRLVEGKHMHFFAPVYGTLLSNGGNIILEENLSAGAAKSPGGSITVKERASNSIIEAVDGRIELNYAESCTIIGREVIIDQGINCTILADSLTMGISEGCAIAAKSVKLKTSAARKHIETVITLLVPDPSGFHKQVEVLSKSLEEKKIAADAFDPSIAAAKSDPSFAKFLSLKNMVSSGKLKFSPEQEQNFNQSATKFSSALKALEKILAEKQSALLAHKKVYDALESLKANWGSDAAGRQCKITEVVGATIVQQMLSNMGLSYFSAMPAKDMTHTLRQHALAPQRIFSGHHGGVDWQYKAD